MRNKSISQDFTDELDPRWRRHIVGRGVLESTADSLRFVVTDATRHQYVDAQIDDYQGLSRRDFPWQPPLQLTVRARFSHPAGKLRGTAGFGFWNDPFMMTEPRPPILPRAIWFFYGSSPCNMKLDLETPGHGWKAATIDALRPAAFALVPIAPLVVLLMNARSLYRALWPPIQRALNVRESLVEAEMIEWHTYTIKWGVERAHFSVDGEPVLKNAPSPRGPLGFVMWMDNQYLVIKPWGRIKWGSLNIRGRQWMEVERLAIELSTEKSEETDRASKAEKR